MGKCLDAYALLPNQLGAHYRQLYLTDSTWTPLDYLANVGIDIELAEYDYTILANNSTSSSEKDLRHVACTADTSHGNRLHGWWNTSGHEWSRLVGWRGLGFGD